MLVNANLEQQICRGISVLNRKTLNGEPRGKDTPFKELKGSLVFRNGLASNQDLLVRIPGLTVKATATSICAYWAWTTAWAWWWKANRAPAPTRRAR